jgi:MerR family mercuric resistance operon transcriptional regulator
MNKPENQSKRMTIGPLSRLTGCNIETIRYYERIHLLSAAARSEGNHRVYSEDHVKRLFFIRRCRELGFTLEEVRELLRLVDGGTYTCAEVRGLTLDHADVVHRKIADLRKLERVLRDMAARCDSGNVPECPIIDVLFEIPA